VNVWVVLAPEGEPLHIAMEREMAIAKYLWSLPKPMTWSVAEQCNHVCVIEKLLGDVIK